MHVDKDLDDVSKMKIFKRQYFYYRDGKTRSVKDENKKYGPRYLGKQIQLTVFSHILTIDIAYENVHHTFKIDHNWYEMES